MGRISFHIILKEEEVFLKIQSEKPVFWEDLCKAVSKDCAALLLKELRKKESGSLHTCVFREVPLSNRAIFPLFSYLKEYLHYQGEKLRVDLKNPTSVLFEVLDETEKGCEVRLLLEKEGKEFSPQKYIPSTSMIYIHEGSLGFFTTDLNSRHLLKLIKGPALIRHFYEEEVSYRKASVESLPVLQVQDPYGRSIKLVFFLSSKKELQELAISDPKYIEAKKDLLEMGWLYLGKSLFQIASSKLYEALEFFSSMGWEIYDHQNRPIVFGAKLSVFVEDWALEVDLAFKDQKVPISTLQAIARSGHPFVSLGEKTGLLDFSLVNRLKDFSQLKIEGKKWKIELKDLGVIQEEDGQKNAPSLIKKLLNPPSITLPQTFLGEPFSYQKKGISWLYLLYLEKIGGLLADEMGLGKTVQILGLISLIEKGPILVVAPAHLVYNWSKECKKFLDREFSIHLGKDRKKEIQQEGLIFTSYSTLVRDLSLFSQLDYELIVMDESSYIKNPKSENAKALSGLKARAKFALNGTPIENCYEDLWAQFFCVEPSILGEKGAFSLEARLYQEKMVQRLSPFLLKRTKKEVAIDMPPIFSQNLVLPMNEEHARFYEEQKNFLKKAENLSVLEGILRLRQSAISPSLLGENIESEKISSLFFALEELQSQKVLIFSSFTKVLSLISTKLEKKNLPYLYIDGKVSLKKREELVKRFQEEKGGKIFLLSLKASYVGLNLTAANYVFLMDPWWNESAENQAIARAHRIGRKEPLFVKRYITQNTIEEQIDALKKDKILYQSLIDQALKKEDLLHLFC